MPTKKQIADLQKEAEKIQGDLDASVVSGEIESASDKVGDAYDPEASATRINHFNAALNVAIDQARQQRKDKTLDFMHGVVPAGALPATSFAGVLSAFDTDSAPLESALIDNASEFAVSQEEQKAEMVANAEKAKEEARNSIRDLALSVGKAGGGQEVIDGVLALIDSGDIDAALKVAAASLHSKDEQIRQVGSNLVRINDDGQVEVLYTAPNSGGSAGVKFTPTEYKKLEGAGMLDAPREEQLKFLGYTDAIPDEIAMEVKQLPEEIQDQFMNDYEYIKSFTQAPTAEETTQFWKEWKAAYDATKKKTKVNPFAPVN